MPGFFTIGSHALRAALTPDMPRHPGVPAIFDGRHVWIHVDGQNHVLEWHPAVTFLAKGLVHDAGDVLIAPMPGAVLSVATVPGATVAQGETLMVIESMKLETAIKAPRSGIVAEVHVGIGQTFNKDARLISLESEQP